MEHKFGGLWTQKKIEILRQYLHFYATALKNQPFRLHYADAFAGTGTHIPDESNSTQDTFLPIDALKGSVTTALDIEPGFYTYHFNDLNPEHISELEKLKVKYPGRNISITQMDANDFVPHFCSSLNGDDRAVLFIDPYSSQLNWDTLKAASHSQKVDVWLLFPLSVIIRMTPQEADKIKPEWNRTLRRLLGTDDWQQALYKPVEKPAIADLFGEIEEQADDEWARVNWVELQKWVTNRLRKEFPYVADPFVLKNQNRPLFSFYFIVSNPSPAAWGLAARAADHILVRQK